jgi:hypothetical protein
LQYLGKRDNARLISNLAQRNYRRSPDSLFLVAS